MSQTSSTSISSRQMVTAFFDDRDDAENAVERIVDAGVARSEIRIVEGADTSRTTSTSVAAPDRDRGFLEALGDFFMPDEDKHAYAEGLSRGGYLVTVPTSEANRDAILDILDDEGTVDMDERETTWRSEGWSGHATGYDAISTGAGTTTGIAATSSREAMGATRVAGSTSSTDDRLAKGALTDRDGTIEVVEERLNVGKRDVSHGRVRVRSYVVEDAVSEDVSLHSERVDIERRTVDRPVASFDAAFKDRTIELEETSQEAVASKDARVKEEIDLRKVGADRTETVSDTVRRTEVEVEDERRNQSLTAEEISRRNAARKI